MCRACPPVRQGVRAEGHGAEADRQAAAAPPGGPRQKRARRGEAARRRDLPLDRRRAPAAALEPQAGPGERAGVKVVGDDLKVAGGEVAASTALVLGRF